MSLRCIVVDDSLEFLEVASALLEREGLAIVGVASTIAQALQVSEDSRPDVALVDVNLGDESGFDLARLLARGPNGSRAPVILISTHSGDDYVDMIEASHAIGFIAKAELSASAIHAIINGIRGDGTADS